MTYQRSCLSALFHTHCADSASSSFTAAVRFAIGREHSTVQFATAGWEQFAIAGWECSLPLLAGSSAQFAIAGWGLSAVCHCWLGAQHSLLLLAGSSALFAIADSPVFWAKQCGQDLLPPAWGWLLEQGWPTNKRNGKNWHAVSSNEESQVQRGFSIIFLEKLICFTSLRIISPLPLVICLSFFLSLSLSPLSLSLSLVFQSVSLFSVCLSTFCPSLFSFSLSLLCPSDCLSAFVSL